MLERISNRRMAFGLVLCAIVSLPVWLYRQANAARPVTLTVKPGTVAGNLGSVQLLHTLATGGFTPAYKATAAVMEALRAGGERRMRLINVGWGTRAQVRPNGTLDIHWSPRLEHELSQCREYGFIPHIIIGQTDPAAGRRRRPNGHVIGVKSWPRYRAYVKALIRHVVVDWGFSKSEWEVGNEMDNPKFNWVDAKGMRYRLDPAGYRAYLKLYGEISRVFATAKEHYRHDTLLLGGPALTQNSFNYPLNSRWNWTMRFIHDVTADHLVCDFISMHGYGSAFSRLELGRRVKAMEAAMRADGRVMPIWFTEWGANAIYTKAPVNFSPVAGAYSLAFISALAGDGVSEAIFIAAQRKPGGYGPALFAVDGRPADAYRALQYIARLRAVRVACHTDSEHIGCLAARDGDKLTVLVWYIDWQARPLGRRERSGPRVSLRIKVTGSSAYALTSVRLNGRPASGYLAGGSRRDGVVGTIKVPYGTYASLRLAR